MSARVDWRSPARSQHKAERVSRGVGVDVVTFGQQPGAEGHHLCLRHVEVVDHDVEVQLLRVPGVRPRRRLVVSHPLESGAEVVSLAATTTKSSER